MQLLPLFSSSICLPSINYNYIAVIASVLGSQKHIWKLDCIHNYHPDSLCQEIFMCEWVSEWNSSCQDCGFRKRWKITCMWGSDRYMCRQTFSQEDRQGDRQSGWWPDRRVGQVDTVLTGLPLHRSCRNTKVVIKFTLIRFSLSSVRPRGAELKLN